jgi:DNA-binding MarR family transcriptional regulator
MCGTGPSDSCRTTLKAAPNVNSARISWQIFVLATCWRPQARYSRDVADVSWLDAEEQQAWRTFINVHGRLLAQLDAELEGAHELSLPDYEVLVHLSEAPEHSLRMAELADRLLLSPSGLTRRLDGLVREGLVERRACPSDRRGTLAVLTSAGMARLEEAAPTHAAGVRRYMIDPLSRDELLRLASSLGRIDRALDDSGVVRPLEEPLTETPATARSVVGG